MPDLPGLALVVWGGMWVVVLDVHFQQLPARVVWEEIGVVLILLFLEVGLFVSPQL